MSIDTYISDEQWYVSASLNIYRKIFSINNIISKYNESYALYTVVVNSSCFKEDVERELLSALHRVYIDRTVVYKKLNAFIVIIPLDLIEDLKRLNLSCISDIVPGKLPDENNINAYMNLEHPPLVKYLIGASMVLGGYNSFFWRLPSIIAGFIIVILIYIILFILIKDKELVLLPLSLLIATFGIVYDKLFSSMTSIAMLDVFVALFTLLALLASITNKIFLASLFIGLAASSKMTGFFPVPWLYMVSRLNGNSVRKSLFFSLLIPLLVFIVTNIPLILHYGLEKWISEIYSAIKWHTTSRPPGPPSTDPVGLILSKNPFPLYYLDGILYLSARCNPGICVVGFIVSMLSLVLFIDACSYKPKEYKPRGKYSHLLPAWMIFNIWLGYVAVYIAGNHTLYTFYMIHLQPIALILVSSLPYYYEELLVKPFSKIQLLLSKPNIIVKACSSFEEIRALIRISREPLYRKLALVYIVYLWVLVYVIDMLVPIVSKTSVLNTPCIHSYGFNPINSFICVYTDNYSRLIILVASFLVYIFFFYNHIYDLNKLLALILASPLFIFMLSSDLANLFAPIFLLSLYTPRNSLIEGVVLGFFAPNPIYSIAVVRYSRTMAGFIMGQALAQLFMFLQGGIDAITQIKYWGIYVAISLALYGIMLRLRIDLLYSVLISQTAGAPYLSILGIYVIERFIDEGKFFKALLTVVYLTLLFMFSSYWVESLMARGIYYTIQAMLIALLVTYGYLRSKHFPV